MIMCAGSYQMSPAVFPGKQEDPFTTFLQKGEDKWKGEGIWPSPFSAWMQNKSFLFIVIFTMILFKVEDIPNI